MGHFKSFGNPILDEFSLLLMAFWHQKELFAAEKLTVFISPSLEPFRGVIFLSLFLLLIKMRSNGRGNDFEGSACFALNCKELQETALGEVLLSKEQRYISQANNPE